MVGDLFYSQLKSRFVNKSPSSLVLAFESWDSGNEGGISLVPWKDSLLEVRSLIDRHGGHIGLTY